MEISESLPTDSSERRRIQNRIAQRKFRQKQRAAECRQTRQDSQPDSTQVLQLSSTSQQQQSQPFPSNNLFASGIANLDGIAHWGPDIGTGIFNTPAASSSTQTASDLSQSSADLTSPSTAPSSLGITDSFQQVDFQCSGMPTHNSNMQTTNMQLDVATRYRSDGSISEASSISAPDDGWLGTLHIAAQQGHDGIVRMLLRRNISFNDKDSDGRTPLMLAVIGGHESATKSLLAYGARMDEADFKGRSVLHWAVLQRHENILRLLLEFSDGGRKLNIDYYDNVGWTALHCAVQRGFEAGTLLLLQAGANLHFKAKRCPTTGNVIPPDLL